MKIVHFLASGGGGYGGAEKVCVELCNALAERHQVTAMVVRGCSFIDRFAKAVHVVELTSNPTINNPLLHYEIYQQLRDLRPDLVHTHAVKATVLVRRVNRFLGLKHVGTKHNDRKGKVFNAMDWVTTISQKAKNSIVPRHGGVVRVIYNGIVEEEVVKRHDPDIFTMIVVGRLEKIKGFDILVQQVANLTFPYNLLIVGDGPEEKNLLSLVMRLGLSEKVKLLGYRENIAQLMHDSHVVLISSHKEGGPRIIAEALFYAPALISTPVGVVPEVLPQEFIACQSQLGEKIADLYQNYEQYTRQFEDLRRLQKGTFLYPRILKQYEEIYYEIVRSDVAL
jgi:glycosyltransferase involved in cell wall biosynthesis